MRLKKVIILLMLINFGGYAYAALPSAPCHSVCSKSLPMGSHCARVGK